MLFWIGLACGFVAGVIVVLGLAAIGFADRPDDWK